ncbi:reverse transcriptase domain-containing protein [Tanacetum coccineum]
MEFSLSIRFYRVHSGSLKNITRPKSPRHLLEKNTPFIFSDDCIRAFQTLKNRLTEAPILIAPNWDLPFELMCDASDFAIGDVRSKRALDIRSKLPQLTHRTPWCKPHSQENLMTPVIFSGPTIYKRCPRVCSRSVTLANSRKNFTTDRCPQNSIQVCEILLWGIDLMGPFSRLHEEQYILVAVDYVSKWVEAKALPTNDARVVCKFLKSLFARFGAPRAIISDRGTHFCNDQFTKVMQKYGVTHRLSTCLSPTNKSKVEVSIVV